MLLNFQAWIGSVFQKSEDQEELENVFDFS